MKKLLLFLGLTLLTIFSCKKEGSNNYIVLTGKVSEKLTDSLSILNFDFKVIKKIAIFDNHNFRDTFRLRDGYYLLNYDRIMTPIYLKPKFSLNISIEPNNQNINYSGLGSNENNYLFDKQKLIKAHLKKNMSSNLASLKEDDFLELIELDYRRKLNFLEKHLNLDPDFYSIEEQSLRYEKLEKISYFEGNKQYVTGNKNFRVSPKYPDPFQNINLSNEKLLISQSYINYLLSYIKMLTRKELENNNSKDKMIVMLETIFKKIKNDSVREELSFTISKYYLEYSKNIDQAFKLYSSNAKKKYYKDQILQKYLLLKNIGHGDVSPTFKFNDINNKEVSLSDFKGSYVYIDIWATWCKPCIVELDKINKLKSELKDTNIAFISICTESAKEEWLSLIEEKGLKGVQLFAEKRDAPFFKDYLLNGYPRFILLDKNGRIIDAFAEKPSNPKLLQKLEKLP